MSKQTKAHIADDAERDAIARAVAFNVHLRISPTAKINVPAATLLEAAKAAQQIRTALSGREPMIYAITASGSSHLVPKAMAATALSEDAAL